MLIFVEVLLLLAYILLGAADHPVAGACSAISMGLLLNLLYIIGSAQQTAEYWRNTGPRWMRLIKPIRYRPNIMHNPVIKTHNIYKRLSLTCAVIFIIMLMLFKEIGHRHYWWIELIIFTNNMYTGCILV
jgi:hypothetical protein